MGVIRSIRPLKQKERRDMRHQKYASIGERRRDEFVLLHRIGLTAVVQMIGSVTFTVLVCGRKLNLAKGAVSLWLLVFEVLEREI